MRHRGHPGLYPARLSTRPALSLYCGIGVFALTARLRHSTRRARLLRVLVAVPVVIATRGEHGRNAIRAALSVQPAASGKPPSPLWCTLRDCPVAPCFLEVFCFKRLWVNPENGRLRRWWFSDRLEEFLCGCMATLGLVVKNST